MNKRWKVKPKASEESIAELRRQIKGLTRLTANLLIQRNITDYESARRFFKPSLDDLHDPFLMKDMDKAVERLNKALHENEKIMVYGDYDVDGTTSVALMYSFLRRFHSKIEYYIPDRYTEGYGISFKGIDFAHQNDITLIIALDCGIKAVDKINYANERNIDFIICDHHTPGDSLPQAIAVLDPKRADCEYPYKELSGCGVGFKLIQAFSSSNSIAQHNYTDLLDLVAVSIASDIVPITGENRTLAHYGLKRINSHPRIGLKSIIQVAGIEGTVLRINDIVFKIGPRINAAGRIDSAREAVRLLTTENEEEAAEIGKKINEQNQTRQALDQNITKEALAMIETSDVQKSKKSTVLYNPGWHKGVIGIVASRLIETYYRPTIILTESNGKITGSARSVYGFNLYEAIDACSDLLENYGGHMYAAGLTLKHENLETFINRFEEVVSSRITTEQTIPVIEVDAVIGFNAITEKFYETLKRFEPFGPENQSPVFATLNAIDGGDTRVVGKLSDHLKLDLMHENIHIPGIAFGMADLCEQIRAVQSYAVCYAIDENNFKGVTTLQLMIKDIRMGNTLEDEL